MCGFVGFTGSKENKENIIKKMSDKIIYRGPDSSGYYCDKNIALGFRRLSIIDLEEGSQPIYNEDKTMVIVFNGEIYNYNEIRGKLINLGHNFKTNSDTEVILHGYEQFGEKILTELRGMFAFSIYNMNTNELFIARDFFGIKPLYYSNLNGNLIFASEIKCILEHPDIKKELNIQALQNYLSFQYSVPNETFFKGINCLPPAHFLKFKDGNIEITKYWNIQFKEDKTLDLENAVNKINDVFKDSVEAHKISDVEVGCFLSSGVDSSYVASQFEGQKSFTVGFDHGNEKHNYNEITYAQEFAKMINQDHYSKKITDEEFWDVVPKVQYYMDQPHADPSCIALYFVCNIASKHVKVVLSGEGADELFGGYRIYHEPFSLNKMKIPRPIWKVLNSICEIIPYEFKGKNYIARASKKVEERFIGNANLFTDKEKRKILKNTQDMLKPQDITKKYYDEVKEKDDIIKMQNVDMNLWMVGDILLKADRMSMANSLELRVPFLDKEVWKVASTLPLKYKVTADGTTKMAMRKAAMKNIPEEVASRAKLGFPVPTREWLKEEKYYSKVKEEFQTENSNKFFNEQEILKLLEDHYKLKKDNSRKIWTIYVFLVWYKQFFN